MQRQQGTLTSWYDDRAFGFIRSGRYQYFLHVANLEDQNILPIVGDTIEFDVMESQIPHRSPRAINARIISVIEGEAVRS